MRAHAAGHASRFYLLQGEIWDEKKDLSASVCDPNSEFSARLFPKLICQWELYWFSSDALKNAL